MKKQYTVTWAANMVLESVVEAESAEAAEKMAMNNELTLKGAYWKECTPTFAEARED
jgi:hypothetical protein